MNNDDLKLLTEDKEEALKLIERAKQLAKLKSNRAFNDIFTEEFVNKNAIRLVGLLSAVSEEQKTRIFNELNAISSFMYHMNLIEQTGKLAESKLVEIEVEIEKAIQEINNPIVNEVEM